MCSIKCIENEVVFKCACLFCNRKQINMYAHLRFFRKESKLIYIVCYTESAELNEVFTISLCFKCISYHWLFHLRSKDTVSIATRLPAGHPKGAGYEIYLFTEPALETTQPPLQWILQGLLSNCLGFTLS
jgi:hypothetical protein